MFVKGLMSVVLVDETGLCFRSSEVRILHEAQSQQARLDDPVHISPAPIDHRLHGSKNWPRALTDLSHRCEKSCTMKCQHASMLIVSIF